MIAVYVCSSEITSTSNNSEDSTFPSTGSCISTIQICSGDILLHYFDDTGVRYALAAMMLGTGLGFGIYPTLVQYLFDTYNFSIGMPILGSLMVIHILNGITYTETEMGRKRNLPEETAPLKGESQAPKATVFDDLKGMLPNVKVRFLTLFTISFPPSHFLHLIFTHFIPPLPPSFPSFSPSLSLSLSLPPMTLSPAILPPLCHSLPYLSSPTYPVLSLSLFLDRKSTRLNSSHVRTSRMPSSA